MNSILKPKQKMQIQLKLPCPRQCKCGGKKIKYWIHKTCGTHSYINIDGDIGCHGGCAQYFIKDTYFRCETSENYEKFRTFGDLQLALQELLAAPQLFNLPEEGFYEFINEWSQNIKRKWFN